MLGMMQNKGGQNSTVPTGGMQAGLQAGSAPSKGAATSVVPTGGMPGNPGSSSGMAPAGNPLAALFMNNQPTNPVTAAAKLPTITAPHPPVIQDPVRRTPVQPAAPSAAPSVYQGPIHTRADLMNYMLRYNAPGANTQGLPSPDQMRANFLRGPGNYWGSNGGHGGSR